mgnify:CR=1 FL=1
MRVGLDAFDEIEQFRTQISRVVRHDDAAGRDHGQHHIEILDVVRLPGIDEDEFERAFQLGDFLKRIAVEERDQRIDPGGAEVFRGELDFSRVDLERRQVAAGLPAARALRLPSTAASQSGAGGEFLLPPHNFLRS